MSSDLCINLSFKSQGKCEEKKLNQSDQSFINQIKEGASDFLPTEDCIAKGLGWTGEIKPTECTKQECVIDWKSIVKRPDCVNKIEVFLDDEIKEDFRNQGPEAHIKLQISKKKCMIGYVCFTLEFHHGSFLVAKCISTNSIQKEEGLSTDHSDFVKIWNIIVFFCVCVLLLGATAGLVVFTLRRRKKADMATTMEDTNPDHGMYQSCGTYSDFTNNKDYYTF